ncbi:MAG: CopD family protein [Halofilum sp. (in: g-proteobacteria)]|nr:CopD family protein [Halofilum sp. (in: g-proteobacteria)]
MIPLSLAVALHALAAVVWVGGMMFAYAFLRPVAGRALEGPARLALWRGVFARFFPVVWVTIAVLLLTGYYMVLGPFGGFGAVGQHIHAMHGLALVMAAIFAHLFFAPWKRFRRAVDAGDHEKGAAELARIGRFVAVNLVLGLIVVVVATGGATGTSVPAAPR